MDPFSDGELGFGRARRRSARGLFIAGAVIALGVALGAGCKPSGEDIERWKATEKGPGKLRDALRNTSLSTELRSQALVALVEIGMRADVEDDLKATESERAEVVHGAVPKLVKLAEGAGKTAAMGDGTTRVQREGKDALFAVRSWARAEDKNTIDDALIAWTTADLEGRMTAGANSTEKILGDIGARAGGRLTEVVADPAQLDVNRTEAARLLGKVADKAAREQAGAKLVEEAKAQKRPTEAALLRLGLVGGDHAVDFLTTLACDPKHPGPIRAKAIFALEQSPDPASLPTALRLAGDAKAPGEVRDAAFELAEKLGPAAVPGLARLLDDKQELVRWRAVEALLTAGKVSAIPTTLDGLSTARAYPKDDLRSYVVHQVTLLGPQALPTLRDQLQSKSWVARIVAVEALGELGKAEDVARLEALGADETKLKGWPGSPTLGAEAKAMAAELKSRR